MKSDLDIEIGQFANWLEQEAGKPSWGPGRSFWLWFAVVQMAATVAGGLLFSRESVGTIIFVAAVLALFPLGAVFGEWLQEQRRRQSEKILRKLQRAINLGSVQKI